MSSNYIIDINVDGDIVEFKRDKLFRDVSPIWEISFALNELVNEIEKVTINLQKHKEKEKLIMKRAKKGNKK